MDFVRSVITPTHRIRAIFNQVIACPLRQTFHEFLVDVVGHTLGKEWWKHQLGMAEPERHAVVRWYVAFVDLRRTDATSVDHAVRHETPAGVMYSMPQTGSIAALMQFGYDLLCLQQKDKLPSALVERLRNHATFQGARYEVAAAAVMMRAGFDIELLDDGAAAAKHCEFIATQRSTGIQIGIEAKSRVRHGVLNTPGVFEYSGDWRGLENLVRKAKKQRPQGIPFFIFVDVNLPLTPQVPLDDKPWVQDLFRMLRGQFGTPTSETPHPFTAIVATNYAQYFATDHAPAPPIEWGACLSPNPKVPLPNQDVCLKPILDSLERYGRIPDQI